MASCMTRGLALCCTDTIFSAIMMQKIVISDRKSPDFSFDSFLENEHKKVGRNRQKCPEK